MSGAAIQPAPEWADVRLSQKQARQLLPALKRAIARCERIEASIQRRRWPPAVKAMSMADESMARESFELLSKAIRKAFGEGAML